MAAWSSLGDRVEPALDTVEIPSNGRELVRAAGGRRALAEQLSGMRGPARRADYATPEGYAAAQRRWKSAQRRVQRYDAPAGRQTRGQRRVTLTDEQRGRVDESMRQRKWAKVVREGARVRMRVKIQTDTPNGKAGAGTRWRELPTGPAVLIPADEMDHVMRAAEEGEDEAAGIFLWDAFGRHYGGFPAEDFVVVETSWVRIWAEGESEPGE